MSQEDFNMFTIALTMKRTIESNRVRAEQYISQLDRLISNSKISTPGMRAEVQRIKAVISRERKMMEDGERDYPKYDAVLKELDEKYFKKYEQNKE